MSKAHSDHLRLPAGIAKAGTGLGGLRFKLELALCLFLCVFFFFFFGGGGLGFRAVEGLGLRV